MVINVGAVDPVGGSVGCPRGVSGGVALHAFVRWIEWSVHKAAAACFPVTVFPLLPLDGVGDNGRPLAVLGGALSCCTANIHPF